MSTAQPVATAVFFISSPVLLPSTTATRGYHSSTQFLPTRRAPSFVRTPVNRTSKRRFQSVPTAKANSAWLDSFEAVVLKRAATSPYPKPHSPTEKLSPSTSAEDLPVSTGFTAERIRKLLNSIWGLSAPFWKADRTAKWHALACIALQVTDTSLGAVFTALSGNMITALSERQISAFRSACLSAFALCSIAVPLTALTSFIRSTFVLRWNQFLTKRGLGLYFAQGNYYKLANFNSQRSTASENGNTQQQPDNPDEILQDHFSNFAQSIVDIVIQYIQSAVEIVLYSVMLLKVFPPLYFFILLIVGIGMLLINKIGKHLVDLEAMNLRRAANFRFSLARVRIHAESIAFYNGAKVERAGSEQKLDIFAGTVLALEKVRVPVNMFICSFYYLPGIIPLVVLAPLHFSKKIQLGQMTTSVTAFHRLFDNLSIFVGEYDRYSSFGASVERLSGFISSLESEKAGSEREFNLKQSSNNGNMLNGAKLSFVETPNTSNLHLENVSVDTPDGRRRILENITLSLRKGERLLIVGATGRGKTSLLRAMAGLWTTGSGTIERPPRSDMFFMPQRPYCPDGSLRDQLLYPGRIYANDEQLEAALHKVGLSNLRSRTGGFDAVHNWAEYLSVGETQRVAFARLLLTKPAVVLIDEGTSALDLRTEAQLMELVRELGCTVVSIGHRPSLVQFHNRVLHLNGGGNGVGYAVTDAEEFVYPGAS